MNMLIRFFILMTLLKQQKERSQTASNVNPPSPTVTQQQLFTPFSRTYRILPHDMGFRNHLPNYRYLSFIELNVTGWLTTLKNLKGLDKIFWIISMQEVVYLKEIKFLDKMTVTSTLEGWDNKYIYFQHHFYVKNTIMAIGLTKFLLVNKQGKLSPQVLDMQGEKITEVITTWNANQTAIKSQ